MDKYEVWKLLINQIFSPVPKDRSILLFICLAYYFIVPFCVNQTRTSECTLWSVAPHLIHAVIICHLGGALVRALGKRHKTRKAPQNYESATKLGKYNKTRKAPQNQESAIKLGQESATKLGKRPNTRKAPQNQESTTKVGNCHKTRKTPQNQESATKLGKRYKTRKAPQNQESATKVQLLGFNSKSRQSELR